MRIFQILAFATLVAANAAVTLTASAQDNSDRGYGGPLTVGPNFSTGKQSAPPDYGSGSNAVKKKPAYKPPASKAAAKPSKPVVKSEPKPPATAEPKDDSVANTAASSTAPQSDAVTPASTDPAATDAKPETCRRFDATTGTTLEVACE